MRSIAPQEQAIAPDLVRHVIRQAYERTGLPYTLAHLLRHTMAKSPGRSIIHFAHYVDALNCPRPLKVEVMADWAKQDKSKSNNPLTWARRLKLLRPFARYLQQFEPETEVPDKSVFGSVNHRLTPHIYTENEILDLLKATVHLNPQGGLRSAIFETLFGLLASTGLRVSEAVHLLTNDVDLKHGMLTIRKTKFAKSRYVPLHRTTTKALRRYDLLRNSYVKITSESSFFIGSRGTHLGRQLSLGIVRKTFANLRNQLHWTNRGGHHAPRFHDLRYPNLNKIQTFFKDD